MSDTQDGEDTGAGDGQPLTLDELGEKMGAESIESVAAPPWRQIIIETDGDNIRIVKAEVAGNIELVAVLRSIADQFPVTRKENAAQGS